MWTSADGIMTRAFPMVAFLFRGAGTGCFTAIMRIAIARLLPRDCREQRWRCSMAWQRLPLMTISFTRRGCIWSELIPDRRRNA